MKTTAALLTSFAFAAACYAQNTPWPTSGNVGIGTVSPSCPLEVASANSLSIAYQRTGVAAKKWGFLSDNYNTYWYNITDNVLALTVSNGGNVGIGTTSPGTKFEVNGALRTTDEAGLPSSGKGIELSYQTWADRGRIIAYDRTGGTYKPLNFEARAYSS